MAGYDVVPQADTNDSDPESDHERPASAVASGFQPLAIDFDNLGGDGFMDIAKVVNNNNKKEESSAVLSRSTTSYDIVEDDDYCNNVDVGVDADRLRPDTIDDDLNATQRDTRNKNNTTSHHDGAEKIIKLNTSSVSLEPPLHESPSHRSPPPLAHPTPGQQSLQGACVGNVERLEKSAERFDVTTDQPAPLSLASTTTTTAADDDYKEEHQPRRSRAISKASRSSVYSQPGVLQSPKAGPTRTSRAGSGSGAAVVAAAAAPAPRLTRAATDPRNEDQLLHHPQPHHPPQLFHQSTAPPILPPPPEPPGIHPSHDPSAPYPHHQHPQPYPSLPPEQFPAMLNDLATAMDNRPPSAGSTNTHRQVTDLFQDFDGVHFSLDRDGSIRSGRRISLSKPPLARNSEHHDESIPGQNMVYYPAPVPRVLNLPQRLAKKPAAVALSEQEKRRTQVIGAMGHEARKSAAWLSHPDQEQGAASSGGSAKDAARESKRLSKMPPQLRASAFFDQPPAQLDVQLMQDSAVATLDSILDAAAHAPVSAFTDHPIVGEAGAKVYKERKAKKSKKDGKDKQKHRSTATLAPPGRNHRASGAPSLNHVPTVSEGEADEQRDGATDESTPFRTSYEHHDSRRTPSTDPDRRSTSAAERRSQYSRNEKSGSQSRRESFESDYSEDRESEEGSDEDGADDDDDDDDAQGETGAAPTTLLAELQSRQKEQKQRNRTAATAFPNGMHSTLLELDAVAQRKRQNRNQKHVTLAWEDPDLADSRNGRDDEDVPLAMLFPEKNKAAEESRPIGLMEQLQLDENEPLSRRRARMRGENPDALRRPSPNPAASNAAQRNSAAYTIEVPGLGGEDKNGVDDEDEIEGETLAQRLKRLKSREGNGTGTSQAASTLAPRPLSSDFASELLSTIQPQEEKSKEKDRASQAQLNGNADGDEGEAEETLGQRRKRLQAESAAAAHNRNKSNFTARSSMMNLGGQRLPGNNNYNPPPPSSGGMSQGLLHHQPQMGGYPASHMSMGAATTGMSPMMHGQPAPMMMNNNPYAHPTASPYGNGMSSVNLAYYPDPAANRRSFAAQSQMAATAEQMQAETIDPQQRAMIDRWRLSVR